MILAKFYARMEYVPLIVKTPRVLIKLATMTCVNISVKMDHATVCAPSLVITVTTVTVNQLTVQVKEV